MIPLNSDIKTSNIKKDELKDENTSLHKNMENALFGIQEAPVNHPLNENGNLKIILE